jgi:hypothetical protein
VGEYRWLQITGNYKYAVRKQSGGQRVCQKGDFDAGKSTGKLTPLVDFFYDCGKYRIKSEKT